MKNYVIIAVAVIIGVAIAFAAFNRGEAKALSVNEIADPAAFSGTITVTGLMAGVSDFDKTIFGMIDLKELQCKSPNCNKVVIPVRHHGKLPVLGDEIRVAGSFVKLDNGYVFEAKELKVVKNHKIGG